ncbi:hypothetical protein HanRHA438_Chr08g0351891 [Helianthus annuus]|nr:hypothetical protein HanRHA438_Chr08g0351891 [Helianthus annuus]
MIIHNKGYQTTNNTTHIKNRPKQRYICPFPLGRRVRRHDSTLAGPEEAGAHAKEGAGEDNKGLFFVVVVVE